MHRLHVQWLQLTLCTGNGVAGACRCRLQHLPPLAPPSPAPQLLLSNPALQLLNERAAADEALASALRGVQVEAVSRGSELRLSQRGQVAGRRLRFIPIPTPRWPDLVAVHSEEGELLGGGCVA